MEETGSEVRSAFDILRERMGMPPIEYVFASPDESKSWSRQIVAALRGHWLSESGLAETHHRKMRTLQRSVLLHLLLQLKERANELWTSI